MVSRQQIEAFVADHQDPASIPAGRFRAGTRGKVECVLCGRDGYGVVSFDPVATYPERPRGHRVLLAWVGEELVQVEGPDTAPPPPRLKPWWAQFGRWQIACMLDHDWPCSCGLTFPSFVNLWRHQGAPRPHGWGRAEPPEHQPTLTCEWPRAAA